MDMTNGIPEQQNLTRHLPEMVAYPLETTEREYKSWLDLNGDQHRAIVAKSLIAHANSGGGFLIFGFREGENGLDPDPARPADLSMFSHDVINAIVARFAEPPFHCDVTCVAHPSSGEVFPVVVVPGGHTSPIRAKRSGPDGQHIGINSYYIRRPGPASEQPQSGREWDELIRRCVLSDRDRLVGQFRRLIQLPDVLSNEGAELGLAAVLDDWSSASDARWEEVVVANLGDLSRFEHGTYTITYCLNELTTDVEVSTLLEALRAAEGPETGWPMWLTGGNQDLRPYPFDGVVECWLGAGTMFADAAHSDFWRASRDGLLYIRRGYEEDSTSQLEPGTILDLTLPVWRVAEGLLHARRLAEALDPSGRLESDVEFTFRWSGLNGRRLKAWSSNRSLSLPRLCRQEEVRSRVVVSTRDIDSQLPDLTFQATRPLYEAFDFFTFARQHHQQEVERFRRR